jgi:hypothetical protein
VVYHRCDPCPHEAEPHIVVRSRVSVPRLVDIDRIPLSRLRRGGPRVVFAFRFNCLSISDPRDSNGTFLPWREKSQLSSLFAKYFEPGDSLTVKGGVDEECANSPELLKASRSEVLYIREQTERPCVALQHALVENNRNCEVLAPEAHTHHEVKISSQAVASTGLTHAVIGYTVGQHTVFDLVLEPSAIKHPETSSNERLRDKVIAALETYRLRGSPGDFQKTFASIDTDLFPGETGSDVRISPFEQRAIPVSTGQAAWT